MATLERVQDVFSLSRAIVVTGYDHLGAIEEEWLALTFNGQPVVVFQDAGEAGRVLAYLDTDSFDTTDPADVLGYVDEAVYMCKVTHKTIRP